MSLKRVLFILMSCEHRFNTVGQLQNVFETDKTIDGVIETYELSESLIRNRTRPDFRVKIKYV